MTRHADKETSDSSESLGDLAWMVETEGRVWAIRPEMLQSLHGMRASAHDLEIAANAMQEHLAEDGTIEAARGRGRPPMISGDVAVIPLKGVLMPQMSLFAMIFGLGSSLGQFRSQLQAAVTDQDVGAIVLDIDSPGGLVDLIPEAAAEVRAARDVKPVIAVSNTLIASAAYWIGSQATELVVTPSGEVGSIGVYATHQDVSEMQAAMGVKTTLVSAGKYKTEGNPYEPLDDAAREAIQASVNDYYNMFVKDVATGRDASIGDVKGGFGEGRVLPAKRAVDAKLADRIDTLDGVVSGLMKRNRGGGGSGSGAHRVEDPQEPTYTAEDRERIFGSIEAVAQAATGKEVVT